MNPTDIDFSLDFEVRDYECDLQGIVNNAVYQHYLEHTRHKFLNALGLDFSELHNHGMDAVVTKIELEYRQPLKSGDAFFVTLLMEPRGRLQLVFYQTIVRPLDNRRILDAKVTAAILKDGKPFKPDLIINARDIYLANRTR